MGSQEPGLLLAPLGSSWLFLALPGSSWLSLALPGSAGSPWLLLAPLGGKITCKIPVTLAPPGSSWPPCSWLLLAPPPGSPWPPLVLSGSSWFLLVPTGSSWSLTLFLLDRYYCYRPSTTTVRVRVEVVLTFFINSAHTGVPARPPNSAPLPLWLCILELSSRGPGEEPEVTAL